MKIKDFDFGAEDARNLPLFSEKEKKLFIDSFVVPESFNLDHFFEGRKSFVYGSKGSGKTALLQYIRIHSEEVLGATTQFYYFQSTFSETELSKFRKNLTERASEEIVDDTIFRVEEDSSVFWRLFFLDQIAKMLRRRRLDGKSVETYFKAVEASKTIASSEKNKKKYPSLEKFHLHLSKNPSIDIEGSFSEAGPEDLQTYFEVAEDALDDVYIEFSPIFLFVDEMEFIVEEMKVIEFKLQRSLR